MEFLKSQYEQMLADLKKELKDSVLDANTYHSKYDAIDKDLIQERGFF